jgi:hypothetical protein
VSNCVVGEVRESSFLGVIPLSLPNMQGPALAGLTEANRQAVERMAATAKDFFIKVARSECKVLEIMERTKATYCINCYKK